MDLNEKYSTALRFSRSFDRHTDPRDMVHDCYVFWQKYYKSDLFEQEIGMIHSVVKQRFIAKWKAESFGKKGTSKRLPGQQISTNDMFPDGDLVHDFPSGEDIEGDYISNEIDQQLQRVITERLVNTKHGNNKVDYLAVYNLMKSGYRHKDLTEHLDMARSGITKTMHDIRKVVSGVL